MRELLGEFFSSLTMQLLLIGVGFGLYFLFGAEWIVWLFCAYMAAKHYVVISKMRGKR